jgi:hypothetical protein
VKIFPTRLRFATALLLVSYLGVLDVVPAAAGLVASRVSERTSVDSPRAADLVIVQRALENRIVAQKLRDYGVAPAEARIRVASLSDQDLHTLASASKGLPSGGDGIGALIGLLIVVLLVILILKLLNKQIIVK